MRTAGLRGSFEAQMVNRAEVPAGGPTVWRRHYEAKHPASRGTKSQMDAHLRATSDVPLHSPIKEPIPECFTS